jgi:Tripartite tricarboxylate transporter family receptor
LVVAAAAAPWSIKRSALAPELLTMAESGFPGFEAVPWFGLLAPTGTLQRFPFIWDHSVIPRGEHARYGCCRRAMLFLTAVIGSLVLDGSASAFGVHANNTMITEHP